MKIIEGYGQERKGYGKSEGEWYQFSDIKDYEEYVKAMKYSDNGR